MTSCSDHLPTGMGHRGESMVFLQDANAEMRQDGIRRSKGVYCIKCGRFFRDWGEFFKHHRKRHPMG